MHQGGKHAGRQAGRIDTIDQRATGLSDREHTTGLMCFFVGLDEKKRRDL